MIIKWKGSDIDLSSDTGKTEVVNTLQGHIDAKGRPRKENDLLREYAKSRNAIDSDDKLSEDEQDEKKDLLEAEFVKIIKDFFEKEPLIFYIKKENYGWARFSRRKTGKEGSAENTANVRYAENLKLKEVKDGDVRERLSGVGALKFAERGTQDLNLPPFDFRTFIATQKNNNIPIQEDMILKEIEDKETGNPTGVFSFKPERDVRQDGKNYHFKMTYGNIKPTDLEEAKTNHIREVTGQNPTPEKSKPQALKIGSDVFNTEVRFSEKVIKKVTEQAAERAVEWFEYKKTRIPNPTYQEDKKGKSLTPNEPKTMVNYEVVREGTLGGAGSPSYEQYLATIESKAEYFELEVDGQKGLYGFKAPPSSQNRLKQANVEFTQDTDIPKIIEENNAQIQEIFRPYLESATDILVPIICGKFSKSERAEATFDEFKETVEQDDAELEGFTIGSRDNLTDEGKVKLTNLNELSPSKRKKELDKLGKKAFVLKEKLKTKDKKRLTWEYTGEDRKIGDIQLKKNETIDNATYEKVLQNAKNMEMTEEEFNQFKDSFNRTRKTAERFLSFDEYAKLSLDDKEKYAPNLTIQTGAGVKNVKSSINFVGKRTYAVGDLKLSDMVFADDELGEGYMGSKTISFLLALDFYVREEGKFNLKPAGRESANRPMASRVNDLKTKIRSIERVFGDVTSEVES